MSENLAASWAPLPRVQIPVVLPAKVPVVDVSIVHRVAFTTADGRDQEEIIQWEDGAILQVHRPGMGHEHHADA